MQGFRNYVAVNLKWLEVNFPEQMGNGISAQNLKTLKKKLVETKKFVEDASAFLTGILR
jgi:hypothetical protein